MILSPRTLAAETFRVVRILSGDSFVARTSGLTRGFVLFAVDAPELKFDQPGAVQSKQRLEKLILDKDVAIKTISVGSEEFAIVQLQGVNVGLQMVSDGWAWHQPDHHDSPSLAQAQTDAQTAGRGVWAQPGTIEPWKFQEHWEKFGERDAARDRANFAYPWSIAPPNTTAIVMVSNMQKFSDKIDELASSVSLEKPSVLNYAMKISGFNAGLRKDGNLMWWFGPKREVVYVIPCHLGHPLIRGLGKQYVPEMLLEVDRVSYRVIDRNGYAMFAEPSQKSWLQTCGNLPGGLDKQMVPLNDFVKQQDIAVATISAAGIDAIGDKLPFTKGNSALPISHLNLSSSGLIPQLNRFVGSSTIAAGIRLHPDPAAEVSLAAVVEPGSQISQWRKSMRIGWQELFANVPDLPISVAIGISSCDEWNTLLEVYLNSLPPLAERDHKEILDSFRGITLFVRSAVTRNWFDNVYVQLHFDDAFKTQALIKQVLVDRAAANPAAPEKFVEKAIMGRPALVIDTGADPNLVSLLPLNRSTLLLHYGPLDDVEFVAESIAKPARYVEKKDIKNLTHRFSDNSRVVVIGDPKGLLRMFTAGSQGFISPKLASNIAMGIQVAPIRTLTLDAKFDAQTASISSYVVIEKRPLTLGIPATFELIPDGLKKTLLFWTTWKWF
ncbi:thermonuclease family protein [Stieleria sp. TO1_6]|nr:thermonuclease family protein [Stieleria tagensis]